jgi:hypothetical protein
LTALKPFERFIPFNVRLLAKLWRLRADTAKLNHLRRKFLNETRWMALQVLYNCRVGENRVAHVTEDPIGLNDFRQFAIVGSVGSRWTQKSSDRAFKDVSIATSQHAHA